PAGQIEPHVPVALTESALGMWRAEFDARVVRPEERWVSLGELGQAGMGGLADAHGILVGLRGGRLAVRRALHAQEPDADGEVTTLTVGEDAVERSQMEHQLAAALARAYARADRGRTLAARGGSAQGLQPFMRLEEEIALAREFLAIPVLDS